MADVKSGGPAYPLACPVEFQFVSEGMTLRDKVALEVFVRLATDQELATFYEQDATHAFEAADAFLAAREVQHD